MNSRSSAPVLMLLGLIVLGLVACASLEPITGFKQYAPSKQMLGQTPEQFIALLGKPAAALDTPTGRRLIFTRGPFGRHSYAVDFNAKREAIAFEQLLHEEQFAKIQPGMGEEAVIAVIGPSTVQEGLAMQWGYVWSYRFENGQCIWFQIEWDYQMKVRSAGYGIPPECQRRGRWF